MLPGLCYQEWRRTGLGTEFVSAHVVFGDAIAIAINRARLAIEIEGGRILRCPGINTGTALAKVQISTDGVPIQRVGVAVARTGVAALDIGVGDKGKGSLVVRDFAFAIIAIIPENRVGDGRGRIVSTDRVTIGSAISHSSPGRCPVVAEATVGQAWAAQLIFHSTPPTANRPFGPVVPEDAVHQDDVTGKTAVDHSTANSQRSSRDVAAKAAISEREVVADVRMVHQPATGSKGVVIAGCLGDVGVEQAVRENRFPDR